MDKTQAKALREPFPPEAIGQLPKGGTMLDYVGHAATTSRLLEVDPSWTWEPVAVTDAGLPLFDGNQLWIKLTVCGVTRYGVGDGKNAKECIGDAIRNAAMRFGVALDLWSKEDLQPPSDPAAIPGREEAPPTPAQGPVSPADVANIKRLAVELRKLDPLNSVLKKYEAISEPVESWSEADLKKRLQAMQGAKDAVVAPELVSPDPADEALAGIGATPFDDDARSPE